MITAIYIQSDKNLPIDFGETLCIPIQMATTVLHAILFQDDQYDRVIKTCVNAPENSIIICPEIGLHLTNQQKLIEDINLAIGDKPLQIFTHSSSIFLHHMGLIERL